MPTVVTTRRRRQPAPCRALVAQASPSAPIGCEPRRVLSAPAAQEVLGFFGPLFDELEGTGALDAPVLALDATG
jgi:hypothetical protein